MPPTVVITNARIATGDPRRPWATALSLEGPLEGSSDRLILAAMGSAAEILKQVRPSTLVVDGHGQTIELPPECRVGCAVLYEVSGDGHVTIGLHEGSA